MEPVIIDGSEGEGGGAMLRQALGLSMLLGKPFVMENIRVGRKNPGLSWQHLTALNAAHQACDARVEGNQIGSMTVSFAPGKLEKTRLSLDIGTAGSVTLLLQAFLLPALFSGQEFRLAVKGGTDVAWSIPADYFSNVLLPQLKKYADASLLVRKRGFYPKGGGEVLFTSKGRYAFGEGLPRIALLEQGDVFKVGGLSCASSFLQPSRVAERQASSARLSLARLGVPVDVMMNYLQTLSPGSYLVLWVVCGGEEGLDMENPVLLGASALGERSLRAESVGEAAAKDLRETLMSGAACDEHLADQLIPIMALTGGKLRTSKISRHARSNVYVAEQFLDVLFVVDEERNIISCEPASA
ncbi:RNA 3'-terminal phosphate cyclase [Candidatus Woesearchaeota archaeon]|nr:RNA 3'-terminal phosphate cyclase [Candidatus Woesearchaeota archaeon]